MAFRDLPGLVALATLTLCWVIQLQAQVEEDNIRVGSFNVQIFGVTKFQKEEVVLILCKIVLHYDIILVMEIRDASETVIYSFLERVNSMAVEGETYSLVVSERLGRSSSKEQYAYLYRRDRVEVLRTYQFEDPEDVFEREPYGILVSPVNTAMPQFFLLGIHVRPNDTVSELNFLDDVYDQARILLNTDNAIIMGDLNADCSYLSGSEYESLDLVTDKRFHWFVDGNEDTTTKDTSCAYDRMILTGQLVKHVARNKVEIFRFDQVYGLTYEQATKVSDHYPVGLVVQSSEVTAADNVKVYHDVLKREAELVGGELTVSAFNVRIFGVSKFGNDEVVDILSKIVLRYDIVLIQEIRDISMSVIYQFVERVNSIAGVNGVTYGLEISQRLGRTSSQEQYAYIYRTDTISVVKSLQYNDSLLDVFEREPFSILVHSLLLDIPDFFLLGLHCKPGDVVSELNQLVMVYEEAVTYFGTQNALILGDLNADCDYLSRSRYNELNLVTDPRFMWLINTTADTTTTSTNCAYDRFIVAGQIGDYISLSSVGVFRYDLAYSLNQEVTEQVSDHFPIECLIKGSRTLAATRKSSENNSTPTSHSHPYTSFLASLVVSFLVHLICTYSNIT